MNRRAMITGIGGQDGSLLAELLLEQGYRVFGVLRRGAADYPNLLPIANRIELIEVDLTRESELVRALQNCRPHELYNLASLAFVPLSWERPVATAQLDA